MYKSIVFAASLLLANTSASEEVNGYSDAQARISLQLSQDAYCGKANYLT